MDPVKIIEIKKSVFADNDKDAALLRKELKDKGVFLLNMMSSPGSGKTTTLIRTINLLKDKIRIAVMEADIDGDVDAVKIREATGIPSIQLHTGGMCHLDAEMTRQGLGNLDLDRVDLVEGDDKPLKYPLMFSVCDLVLINKTDVLQCFDFDMDRCRKYIRKRNPRATVLPVSARTGDGIDAFAGWLLEKVNNWKQ